MAAPTLAIGPWQASWSLNVRPSVGETLDLQALRSGVADLLESHGMRDGAGVDPAITPEVSVTPLGLGMNRSVLTVTAWTQVTRFVSMRATNTELARLFLRELTGASRPDTTQVERLAQAFHTNGDASSWTESPLFQEAVLFGVGPVGLGLRAARSAGVVDTSPIIAACAATFQRYDPAHPPRPAGFDSTLERMAARPVARSTNPRRVDTEEPLFTFPGFNWPVSPTELKVAAVVVGGVVVLGVIGYALRSYAVARIASA